MKVAQTSSWDNRRRVILFVCSNNTCRSPVAKALFEKKLREKVGNNATPIEAYSAGINARDGRKAASETVNLLRSKGIDISKHTAIRLNDSLVNKADIILAVNMSIKMEIEHRFPTSKGKVFTLKEYAGLPKKDESMNHLNKRRKIPEDYLIELETCIEKIVADVGKLGKP